MNYKRQIKEAAFRLRCILPERELDRGSTELVFLESRHMVRQRCLRRDWVLPQQVTALRFGSFDHRGNWRSSSRRLAVWYECDHARHKPFQGKGRRFYKVFLTFSQMLRVSREGEALRVRGRWQRTCLPAALRPAFASGLGSYHTLFGPMASGVVF